ncbi:MAG TPA: hypothetical protein PLY45_02680, partial [bacterium]|nr:hypothetical protein [bacterium]
MVKEIPLNPLLIFPHGKSASDIGQSLDHSISSVKFASGEASRGSPFIAEPFELSQAQWVWLATQRWPLFEAWMKNPSDPSVRLKLAREALGPEMRAFSDEGFSGGEPVSDEYVDLTGVSPKGLNDFFARAGGTGPAFIQVVIEPDGNHRIEWRRAPFIKEKEVRRAFSSEIERGSPVYRLSNHTALGKVVTSVSDRVIEGGLALVIPDYAIFDSPSRIALSAKGAGEIQYFRVGESAAPKGSSVEFIISPSEGLSVSERFRVGDLVGLLERDAIAAWKRGKLPALALDLDGTLFDARGYTVLLFREWLARYDGPDAKAVRDLVAKAGDVTGWNGREILKVLGVTRPETLQSAYEYHERYFFDPIRRASSLPINGTIKLIKLLQDRLAQRGVPLKRVAFTLRNAKDD